MPDELFSEEEIKEHRFSTHTWRIAKPKNVQIQKVSQKKIK